MMKWKPVKGGIALLMAALLAMPTMPSSAQEDPSTGSGGAEAVYYNTGDGFFCIAESDVSGGDGSEYASADGYFAEDGSYTIKTELNAFFPYEVQFACGDEVTNEWFMDPDSTVEVGGHTFRVETETDGTAVTQMSLEVGGDTIVVYPEEKNFSGIATISLLPIKEDYLGTVDLSAYTPVELTQVSVKALLGDKVADGDMIAWKLCNDNYDDDYDYNGSYDDYSVQSGSIIDLSKDAVFNSDTSYEIIVGTGGQLGADNTRYRLSVRTTPSSHWLIPTVYALNEWGERVELPPASSMFSRSGYIERGLHIDVGGLSIYVGSSVLGSEPEFQEVYVSLKVNPDVFPGTYNLRAFQGKYTTASEAMSRGKEITDQIFCTDMTQLGAGFLYTYYHFPVISTQAITMISFDNDGNVTGCLPVECSLLVYDFNRVGDSEYLIGEAGEEVAQFPSSTTVDGCIYQTYTLYKGYADDGIYYKKFRPYVDANYRPDALTVYLGLYDSAKEAAEAGAVDITSDVISEKGYGDDYSNGVYMTAILNVGPDQEVFKYCIKTVESNVESSSETESDDNSLSGETDLYISNFKTNAGEYLSYYQVKSKDDSYSDFNFLTFLVDQNVTDEELASLAPEFSLGYHAKLYTAGSSSPEVSGESFHDFSKPVQYTVISEDGENSENYWVQVVRAKEGKGSLYLNSLADPDAKTEIKDGIIYSTREVVLSFEPILNFSMDVHDILLANMGTEPLDNLSVELVSDTVELDDYWTLRGDEDLSGFVDLAEYQLDGGTEPRNGELWNLAKLRIRAKEEVKYGTEISGTLTVKSAGKTLLVLTLTGMVGAPEIITEEIPEAVLYVPYGSVIQNNNKYSKNEVKYILADGSLPEGMTVKPNGEIYGVPRETGEFTFSVSMENSHGSFESSYRTYTMIVRDNTDENVDSATDPGYELLQRIQDIDTSQATLETQTIVSQGAYHEFTDVYLDGLKLVKGEDYTSESGSTRITIRTQTLAARTGRHTLGIEFRTEAGVLKRAAQNYVVEYAWEDKVDDHTDQNVGYNDAGNDDDDNSGDDDARKAAFADANAQYIVVKGDTLSAIAVRFGIALSQLLSWNPQIKNPNLIYPGQVIVVGRTVAGLVNGESGGVFAVVQKGDCLYKIARRNGVFLKTVLNLNPEIAKQKYIYAGQKVRVK